MALTRKQAAFVKHLLDNPKDSATEAAEQSYNLKNRQTAGQVAHENLRKPEIISELAKHNTMIESALINTVAEWKEHEKPRQREIAMDSAKYIHDKIHGKATQKVEQTVNTVNLTLSLSDLTD